MSNIAVFGLGAMGYGIAASVLRAGHVTHGFDVVPAQVDRFRTKVVPQERLVRWQARLMRSLSWS